MAEILTRLMESLVWFCTGYVTGTIVTSQRRTLVRRRSRRDG